jgi:hypothetical protein
MNIYFKLAVPVLIAVLVSSASAGVTVHGTTNGTTTVSCTGGCEFTNGWLGSVKVCDVNDVCINIIGKTKEKKKEEVEK